VPLELKQPTAAAPIGARLIPASRGWAEVHPDFRESFAAARLMTAEMLLALPGEIVSGHPDRHVVRVELPGGVVGYLKKQHRVSWRERLKSPRCIREAKVLKHLAAKGFPCPKWIAFGEDGDGRAFVIVEELKDARELRSVLSDSALSPDERLRLAVRIGQAIAELHAAGFGTPDLSAKHVFVDPSTCVITLIDWQNSRSGTFDPRPVAALDASLAAGLSSPRERLRVLWAYARVCRESGMKLPRFSKLSRELGAESERLASRRSIRDQREAVACEQRLVWLADEAVCAIPEIAAIWPKPAVVPPYYSCPSGTISIQLADGRLAKLIRGRSFAPLGRLVAWLRGKSWRSPGMAIARDLFERERHGRPGPALYAFGQRFTSRTTAEWFVLHSVDNR
jgi:hypothetical protein